MDVLSAMTAKNLGSRARDDNSPSLMRKNPCRIVCLMGFLAFLSCVIAIIRLLTDFVQSISENESFLRLLYEMHENFRNINETYKTCK